MASICTIVIPTYDRPGPLARAVASVATARPAWADVIVVDQTPVGRDGATEVLRRYDWITYLRLDRPGLTRARNAGLAAARTGIVLFMDDDAVMEPGCVEEHVAAHAIPGVGIVGGRIRQRGAVSWAAVDTVARLDALTGEGTGNFDLDHEGKVPYVSGGNLSVKKAIVSGTGPFNTRFRGNALFEEVEFCCRLRTHGYGVWYCPRAVVAHYPAGRGGCHADDETRYLLDRMHNHAMFYFLHVRRFPSAAFLRSMRALAEYIARRPEGGHSLGRVGVCMMTMARGYADAVLSMAGRHGRGWR
jgi:GT2 family glycosyltransferase